MSAPSRTTPWVLALVASVVVPLLTFATQQGSCLDAPAGGASFCTSGPAVGWEAAWAITAACAALLIVSVVQLVSSRRSG